MKFQKKYPKINVDEALDSLKQEKNGDWTCRFITLFRNDGQKAEIKISDSENPNGGWEKVPSVGSGAVVNNNFRRNTAIIDVVLPKDNLFLIVDNNP